MHCISNFGRIGIILSVVKQCLQILCFLIESDVVFSLVRSAFLGILALLSHLVLITALENCFFFGEREVIQKSSITC